MRLFNTFSSPGAYHHDCGDDTWLFQWSQENTITGVPVAYIMEQNQMLYGNRNLPNISTGLRPSWPYTKRGGVDYRTTKHKSIQIWTQDLCEGRKQACKEYFRPESLRVLIG